MANKTPTEQYIKKVKALLPYYGKNEKKYLQHLRVTVEDYCSCENISTLKDLEEGFGNAEDIVHEYISSVEVDSLIRQLNIRKLAKRIGLIVLIILVLLSTFAAITLYKNHKLLEQTSIFFENITFD